MDNPREPMTEQELGRPLGEVNLPSLLTVRTFGRLTPPPFLRPLRDRDALSVENPLSLARSFVAGILLFATVVAIVLWATGIVPRALELVGIFWALYGFGMGLLGGVLEPLVDGLGRALVDLGLQRVGGGYSAIETLAVRGEYEAAAEAYRERAQDRADRVEATLRRAALLAGVLRQPETAAAELENLRASVRPGAEEDLRIGLALVELYEDRLGDPGSAMAELRRLIDQHPSTRHLRRLRAELADLKQRRFGNDSAS
jgi:hypothetical protein